MRLLQKIYTMFSFCILAYFTHTGPGYNVIAINWKLLASWDNYFGAASNAVKVGKHSAQVLGDLLIEQLGQDPSMVNKCSCM